MNNVFVVPYKTESNSAKQLSSFLKCKRMRLNNSTLSDREGLKLINWGNSTVNLSHLPSAKVFNKPDNIRLASHKIEFFKRISKFNENSSVIVNIPDWTTSVREARNWYADGNDVVCRHVLQGHSGDGIELVKFNEDISASNAVPRAPLYTKYSKKKDEYRVHVVAGKAIFVQRKAVQHSTSSANYQIRNVANGFVFVTRELSPDPSIISSAVNAVNALGLDFGAADVMWNERRKTATVIEVNTACALKSGTGATRYKAAMYNLINNNEQVSWAEPAPMEFVTEEEASETDNTRAAFEEQMRIWRSASYNEGWHHHDHFNGQDVTLDPYLYTFLVEAGEEGVGVQGLESLAFYSNQDNHHVIEFEIHEKNVRGATLVGYPGGQADLSFHIEVEVPYKYLSIVERRL